jgi:hypothetical protein
MIYIATHGLREIGADPSHTPEGLEQVRIMRSLLNFLEKNSHANIKRIILGYGIRFSEVLGKSKFSEVFSQIREAFSDIRVEGSIHFGWAGSRINNADGTVDYVLDDNTRIPAECNLEISDLFTAEEMWACLRRRAREVRPCDVLICANSPVLAAIGIESKSGSVYQVNPTKKKWKPLMEGGAILWENIDIIV